MVLESSLVINIASSKHSPLHQLTTINVMATYIDNVYINEFFCPNYASKLIAPLNQTKGISDVWMSNKDDSLFSTKKRSEFIIQLDIDDEDETSEDDQVSILNKSNVNSYIYIQNHLPSEFFSIIGDSVHRNKRKLEDPTCPPIKRPALLDSLGSPINNNQYLGEEVTETPISCKYQVVIDVSMENNGSHVPMRRAPAKCKRSKVWSQAAKQFLSEKD